MLSEKPMRDGRADLGPAIERQIACRTGGRVRSLRVEVAGGRVAVRGYALSYYVVQLALAAVREVLPSASVDLDVEVLGTSEAGAPLGAARGHHGRSRAGSTVYRTGTLQK